MNVNTGRGGRRVAFGALIRLLGGSIKGMKSMKSMKSMKIYENIRIVNKDAFWSLDIWYKKYVKVYAKVFGCRRMWEDVECKFVAFIWLEYIEWM